MLKLLVIVRSDIAKVSLVMTKSKHDSLLGLFGLGQVISVTSCCIALRSTNSINTSSGLETDGESIGWNQFIDGKLKLPNKIIDALTPDNMSCGESGHIVRGCSKRGRVACYNSSRWSGI